MAKHLQPRFMGPKTLSGLLKTAGPLSRLFTGGSVYAAAAETIDSLDDAKSALTIELAQTRRKHRKEIAEIEEKAKGLFQRTVAAVEELEKSKRNGKPETAVAVILSPSQYGDLTLHGWSRHRKLAKIDIVIAKGVYGPVVLTQEAFDAVTRNAPELKIRAATPSKDSDW